MKNIYFAYLHSCGFSQKELGDISQEISNEEYFFAHLSQSNIKKFIKGEERRNQIYEKYNSLNFKKILAVLEKYKVTIITMNDNEYPESLKHIPHTPFLLYVRGNMPKEKMFGVVGSRKISEYGKKAIDKVVPDIAKIFPIVSGGAAGCDSYAHVSAMNAGAQTVAVVGTGINIHYPVSHQKLYDHIVESGGAVISIFRVDEPGNPYNFPVRNEIVAGLSQGILIIEAKEKSGSLITANLCLDLGKDVFAIPGDITFSNSVGTNRLIQSGAAKLTMISLDVLEDYDVVVRTHAHKNTLPKLSQQELIVYTLIMENSLDLESIITSLGMQSKDTTQQISLLELKGLIKKDISGKYRIS